MNYNEHTILPANETIVIPEIQVKKLSELTSIQTYKILELRFNVFVLEQRSIFPEFDIHDYDSEHIFIEIDGNVAAYARAFKTNTETASFGRVVVNKEYRNKKLGRRIVEETINIIKKMPSVKIIKIEAQEYLQHFYESFGFQKTSEPFDDSGVMHISMELNID